MLVVLNFSSINAGFGSTLRQGNITHHEYIQVNLPAILCLNVYMMAVPKLRSYRSARDEMSGSTRLHYLKAKLLVVMVNKFSVEMFTGSASSLISLECYRSTLQLSDTTSAQWYNFAF